MARYVKYNEVFDFFGGKFAKVNDRISAGHDGQCGINVVLRNREYTQTGRYNRTFAIMSNSTSKENVSPEMEAVRAKFALVVAATNVAITDPEQAAAYRTAFRKQNKYNTLRGFIFSQKWAMN